MAKRQRREKPMKIEERKVSGQEWKHQVKQTALLASPIYIGQTQGKEKKQIKRGAKVELGGGAVPSLLFTSFGLARCHASRMYFPLLSKQNWAVIQSCNTGLSLKFLLWQDRTKKLHTPPERFLTTESAIQWVSEWSRPVVSNSATHGQCQILAKQRPFHSQQYMARSSLGPTPMAVQ